MTDDEILAALATAPELAECANAWRPEVRLVGNVRADSISLICRALLALHAEVERLTKYVAHNDEEYATMKDVLRAEHQECQRLRAENERMRILVMRTADSIESCSRRHGQDGSVTATEMRAVIDAARKAGG